MIVERIIYNRGSEKFLSVFAHCSNAKEVLAAHSQI